MVNYEPFLAHITPAIQGKVKDSNSLSEGEIRAAVSLAYKEAIHTVAKDTGGYSLSLPIHLYEGLKHYPLEVPAGFRLTKVVRVFENGAHFPKGAYFDDEVLYLPCCASKTINNAYTVRASVVPDPISSVCEFDDVFVNEYFQSILLHMRYTLSMQTARQWQSLGLADRLELMYRRSVKKHRNAAIKGVITVRSERLTANDGYKKSSFTDQTNATDACLTCKGS